MAFQFKRDRGENIALNLAGDIDLEITPDIKTQLASQIEDARSLTIDARNVSYLDSSGVSIMVIAMQTCKQKQISFSIDAISDEAVKVLQLAKLDKILPIKQITGSAQMVDMDVFSQTGSNDSQIAADVAGDGPSSDDDLIAALSSGGMDTPNEAEPAAPVELEMTPEPSPEPQPTPTPTPTPQASPAPAATPAPAAEPAPSADPQNNTGTSSGGGDGTDFTPGTF